MAAQFLNDLQGYKVDKKNKDYNFILDGQHLRIEDDYQEWFWESYCLLVSQEDVPHLSEKETDISSLVLSGQGDYLELVEAAQTVLNERFEVEREALFVCVLENDAGEIQIHFPYCRIKKADQRRFLQFLQAHLETEEMTLLSGHRPLYGWDGYSLTAVYNSELELSSFPELFRIIEHPYLQSHLFSEQVLIDRSEFFWVPLFLSQNSTNVWTRLKRIAAPLVAKPKGWPKPEAKIQKINNRPENQRKAKLVAPTKFDILLPMINKERFSRLKDLNEIGRVIHNYYSGQSIGFEIWRSLTDLPVNEDRYVDFGHMAPLTVRTLAWYARIDNPHEYKLWHSGWTNAAMEHAIETSQDAQIARFFFRKFWLDYMCANSRDGPYRFENHHWVYDEWVSVTARIKGDLYHEIAEYKTRIAKKLMSAAPGYERDALLAKDRTISQLMKHLSSGPKHRSIRIFIANDFNRANFINLLDAEPNLIGLSNGVLDMQDREVLFREGKPEDYLHRQTLSAYDVKYHWEHEKIVMAMRYFTQIFPEKADRDCFLRYLSSILKGRNSDKKFVIISGAPHGGKSMIKKLLELIFGCSLAPTIPIATLTKASSSGSGPSPDTAQLAAARVAFSQEPEVGGTTFAYSFIKMVTGGDSFFTRMLHSNGGTIQALFKLILFCNDIPLFSNHDPAIKERVLVFPMISTWEADAPESEEEQYRQRKFKRDNDFESRLSGYARPVLWILVQYLKEYLKVGLGETDLVRKYTQSYWDEHDPVLNFMQTRLVQDPTAVLTWNALLPAFRSWCRTEELNVTLPTQKIEKQFLTRLGQYHNGKEWIGWRDRSVI